MLKELVKVANRLDSLGLTREADALDRWINKMAAGFSAQRSKDIEKFLTESVPAYMKTMSGVVDRRSKKIFDMALKDSALFNQIAVILKSPDNINMDYNTLRASLITAFNNTKMSDTELSRDNSFSFNSMTYANGSNPPGNSPSKVFDDIIVKNVFAEIQKNKNSLQGSQVTDPGVQAQTEGTTYPKATPTAPTPKKTHSGTPTKPSTSAPKRDWAYYLSKQTEPVGKAMETLWSNASMEMNMKPDYASFVSWYKSKGKNMNPAEAARKMFGDVLSKSKDPLVSSVLNSRAAADPENINALYSYVGINPKTYLPASGQEQTTAETRLRAISSAMGHEADAAKAGRQAEDFRETRVSEE